MPESKTCRRCQQAKPLAEFGAKARNADGLNSACRECEAAYHRARYAAAPDVYRANSARYMAKARVDPVKRPAILEAQRRSWQAGGKAKRQAWMDHLREADPFRWKSLVIQTRDKIRFKPADLKLVWDRQAGLCGLTGRPLDLATAHLDHVIPRSRGGTNALDNVRWTTQEANQAKGGLLDDEFLALCREVIRTLAPQPERSGS